MSRIGLIVVCLIGFLSGVYAWRIQRTGHKIDSETTDHGELRRRTTLVVIGGSPLSTEDIEFEYSMLTEEVRKGMTQEGKEAPSLVAIPELGDKTDRELSPLKHRLASQIIERKILYKYIEQEKKFDIQDPARFSSCLKEWDDAINQSKMFGEKGDQDRLKKMLCEKSIVSQYLQERPFALAIVSDAEVQDYYKKHQKEFRAPEQVVIRHIAFPSESEAKAIKREVNQSNFSSLASKLSISPEKEKGGLMGPYSQGQLPQVFDIAFSMRPGEIRGILKSTYGFHYIMLERHIPKQDLSLAQASPKIRELLATKKKEEMYQKWVEQALNVVTVVTPKPLW